jgi:hypothetical protein
MAKICLNGKNCYSFGLTQPKSSKRDKSLIFWPETSKIPPKPAYTVQILIIFAWKAQNPSKRDKLLLFWTQMAKICLNGKNCYSFGLTQPKSSKGDKSLFFWPETNKIPPNRTNGYSFGLVQPKSSKRDKSLFFWPETKKSLQTGQIVILLASRN